MKKLLLLWGGVIATLLFAGACTEYDDSDLKKRVDQVEEDLDNVKEDVEALKRKVDGLNSTYRALTALLNGGIVSDVRPVTDEDGTTGYKLVVTTVVDASTDPVTTQTSEYTVWNGKDGGEGPAGPGGAPGEPGRMPEIGVALDEESGRYYWTLDGEPMTDAEGNRVYATGEKGEDGSEGTPGAPGAPGTPGTPGAPGAPGQAGAAGITPQLKIDQTQKEGQTGDAWFVSYDDGATWTELGVFGGSVETSDIQIAKSPDGKKIIITQGSNTFEFPIVENTLKIAFPTVDTEQGMHVVLNAVYDVEYRLEGGSDRAVVKAEMLDGAGYAVTNVPGENKFKIEVKGQAAEDMVIVHVYDGTMCMHTSFGIHADIATATLAERERSFPVSPDAALGDFVYTGCVTLDMPARERIELAATVGNTTLQADQYTVEPAVIAQGATEGFYTLTVKRDGLAAGTEYELPLTFASPSGAVYLWPTRNSAVITLSATDVPQKIALTAADYTSPYGPDAFPAYGEGDSSVLCDGKSDQHWGSNYWSTDLPTSEYGVYIDVALPADLFAVSFRYQNRNGNGKPTSLALAVSSDDGSSWEKVGEIASGLPSDGLAWFQTPLYNKPDNTSFGMVRFGITTSNMGDLVATPAKSASLMELEVYGLY